MRRSTAKKVIELDGIKARKNKIYLTGLVFGKLQVMYETRNDKGLIRWNCLCECGKEREYCTSELIHGRATSCGCGRRKHGLSQTNIYRRWADMLSRCRCETSNNYKYYGGMGVSVCSEWEQFENFCEWALKNGYSKNLSLDRIDVSGNYEPSNCRWATREEQDNNRRDSVKVKFRNKIYTIKEISKITNIIEHGVGERLKNGVKGKALFYPSHRGKKPDEFKEEAKCNVKQQKSL